MTHDGEQRYLTVISWPQGWSRDDVAAVLSEATGLDNASARLRLGSPPRIFALLPAEQALCGVVAMQQHGGDAFTCALDDLERLGPTLKIKDLDVVAGRLEIGLWRGPDTSVDPRDLDVVVRARLSEEVGLKPILPPGGVDASIVPPTHGWAIGGAYGWAIRLHFDAEYRSLSLLDRRQVVSHKLDLHVRDGRVLQIDGDKFGYRVLGALRGHGDSVNIDRMCELMTHLSPDVVVDPYFSVWRPPPGYERLRLPMIAVNEEEPSFAFYSRWSALMYRHVMG